MSRWGHNKSLLVKSGNVTGNLTLHYVAHASGELPALS